jgi:iron(III) transport system ATP-binding protein
MSQNRSIKFSNVSHSYEERTVLDKVSFSVSGGEIVCLLGPSGCGKTTCLRLASGLDRLQSGIIEVDGEQVAGDGFYIPPEKRNIGFLLQDYALFPHLNLLHNVAFGLNHLPKAERNELALEYLSKVGLSERAADFPHQLSGGEQQRVALVRALAPNPRVMLLDEPFSSLDVLIRNKLCSETRALLVERGVPTIMVTHDPIEALGVADRIIILNHGKIVQIGTGEELRNKPLSEFVEALFATL